MKFGDIHRGESVGRRITTRATRQPRGDGNDGDSKRDSIVKAAERGTGVDIYRTGVGVLG